MSSSTSAEVWKMIKKASYNGIGKQNESAFPEKFVEIVKLSQKKLKEYLENELMGYYPEIITGDGYVYAKGTYPVVLTAHMDTVHKETVKEYWGNVDENGNNIISSPQGIGGDDRCGVYMILKIIQTTDYRPTIIFCEDEEIGGIGSNKFLKEKYELPETRFFIELDRANAKDLVFYNDDNEEFQAWCEKVTGYKIAYGSFSDISHFCPDYGISGVNISCGYHNAHTLDEYVVLEEMENSIEATIKLLEAAKELDGYFEYQEYEWANYYNKRYGYSYSRWDDEYYGKTSLKQSKNEFMKAVVFYYLNEAYEEEQEVVEAEGLLSAIGAFLTEHPNLRWSDILDYDEMI